MCTNGLCCTALLSTVCGSRCTNATPSTRGRSGFADVERGLCELLQIDDACSAYLSRDSQPQASSALEELCFMVMGFLQKPEGLDEKDNTKRSFCYGEGFGLCEVEKSGPDLIQNMDIGALQKASIEVFRSEKWQIKIPGREWSMKFCFIILKQDPNEDTEWNDILRHFGILPPKEKPKDETAEMVLHSQKEAGGK
ncbi:hypothetical protein Q9966_013260 [Columba livia]|nr:hypothetical protein Q9966_013260 [Columba livia]